MRKPCSWFPTRSDTNQALQRQNTKKIARGLKIRILEVEGLCYLCNENKGTEKLCGLVICAFFSPKNRVSHDVA